MLGSPRPMTSRPRLLLARSSPRSSRSLVVGCGGGDEGSGASARRGHERRPVLEDTFSGEKKVDSGKLDLSLKIDVQGGDSQVQGPISLSSPARSRRRARASCRSSTSTPPSRARARASRPGVTSTGDKAFVNFQGTEYVVSDQVFQQFKAGYEQAQKQSADKGNQQSLATLGIDPRRWLTDPKNEGEAKVGDTDTIKITGGVDVNKLLDDVNTALDKARSLGVQGSDQLPEKLTDKQKQEAADAIKDLTVEIYTGKEDTTLRRMVVNIDRRGARQRRRRRHALARLLAARPQRGPVDRGALRREAVRPAARPARRARARRRGRHRRLRRSGVGGGSGSGGASAEELKKYSDCVDRGRLGHGQGAEVRRAALTVGSSSCRGAVSSAP